jgi:hypothetical protein
MFGDGQYSNRELRFAAKASEVFRSLECPRDPELVA